MPPTDRFVISFAAEPPQPEVLDERLLALLGEQFLAACADIDSEGEEIGSAGEVRWFPDRSLYGRTYVPAVARTDLGYELFGYASFTLDEQGEADELEARADFTGDVAEANPDWQLDLNEMVLGDWRGEDGERAEMTLIWGSPLVAGGAVVTAELADHAVDQCELRDQRFTLIAPDNYRGDYLELKLWSKLGQQLAAESLYAEDEDQDEEGDGDEASGADA